MSLGSLFRRGVELGAPGTSSAEAAPTESTRSASESTASLPASPDLPDLPRTASRPVQAPGGSPAIWFGTLKPAVAAAMLGAAMMLPNAAVAPAYAREAAAHVEKIAPRHAASTGDPVLKTGRHRGRGGLRDELPPAPRLGAREVAGAFADAVRALHPTPLSTHFELLQTLGDVRDGQIVVAIPLVEGRHVVGGRQVDVPASTVLRLQLQIQNGRLVPSIDKQGHEVAGGTRVAIEPPLPVLGWVSARGAYLRETDGAQGQLEAELAGWMNVGLGRATNLELGAALQAIVSAGGTSSATASGDTMSSLLRTDAMRFEHAEVTMQGATLDYGAVKIDLRPGNKLTIDGTGDALVVGGPVRIGGLSILEAGLELRSGSGTGELRVDVSFGHDGTVVTHTDISHLDLESGRLDLSSTRHPGDRAPDHVAIDQATIEGGSITIDTNSGSADGKTPSSAAFHSLLDVTGTFQGASISAPDARREVQVEMRPGQIRGRVELGTEAFRLDGRLVGTSVRISDLQTRDAGVRMNLHHAEASGDARVVLDSQDGTFDVDVDVRKLDAQLEDSRFAGDSGRGTLARLDIGGIGRIRASSTTGVQAFGDVRLSGDLGAVELRDRGVVATIASGARFEGHVSGLKLAVDLDGTSRATRPAKVKKAKPAAPIGVLPEGTLSAARVAASSVAELAGVPKPSPADTFRPLDLLRQLDSGKLTLVLPISGTIGSGYLGSAEFPPGTMLRVVAEVAHGRIVPEATKLTFTQPGDAALWVEVRGAYLDEEGSVRLDLKGAPDMVYQDLAKLPLEVGPLAKRLADRPGGGFDASLLAGAHFRVDDATLQGGRVAIPGGFAEVAEGTRFTIAGTGRSATLSGHVKLTKASLAGDSLAARLGAGDAELEVKYTHEGQADSIRAHLSKVDVEVGSVAAKGFTTAPAAAGEYLQLGHGRAKGADIVATFKPGSPLPELTFSIPRFEGEVAGGRLTAGGGLIEIGRSTVRGRVGLDHNHLSLKGQVDRFDVAAREHKVAADQGSLDLGYARFLGSGKVDLATSGKIKAELDVSSADVRLRATEGDLGIGRVSTGASAFTGSGKIVLEGSL